MLIYHESWCFGLWPLRSHTKQSKLQEIVRTAELVLANGLPQQQTKANQRRIAVIRDRLSTVLGLCLCPFEFAPVNAACLCLLSRWCLSDTLVRPAIVNALTGLFLIR
jgi:hypothetical protein